MTTFRYRAIGVDGATITGRLDAADRDAAVAQLRGNGSAPLEVEAAAVDAKPGRITAKSRAAAETMIDELAVLLKAGLQLDRALALAIENVEDPVVARHLVELLAAVREGAPLSRAMSRKPELFSATAVAMTEAGEANGRLGAALQRLSTMLAQAAELRRLVGTSLIYPVALLIVATGVIGLMLLFVVPQFESLFSSASAELPAASRFVMAASRGLREHGLLLLAALIGLGFALRIALRRPAARLVIDRFVLRVPQVGALVRRVDAARFAGTLGALLEGGVPLPTALVLAQRTIGNGVIAAAIAEVAARLKEGGGLTAPIAAANVFPRLAIGFLRTGEESSQLELMLTRLAEVLDREVRVRLQRLIGILTPVITVVLGATVAAIIAAIMSAILGFNDVAVG